MRTPRRFAHAEAVDAEAVCARRGGSRTPRRFAQSIFRSHEYDHEMLLMRFVEEDGRVPIASRNEAKRTRRKRRHAGHPARGLGKKARNARRGEVGFEPRTSG